MVVVPAVPPVTTPLVPIAAIEILLLVHVPPNTASLKVAVPPDAQMVPGVIMVDGD